MSSSDSSPNLPLHEVLWASLELEVERLSTIEKETKTLLSTTSKLSKLPEVAAIEHPLTEPASPLEQQLSKELTKRRKRPHAHVPGHVDEVLQQSFLRKPELIPYVESDGGKEKNMITMEQLFQNWVIPLVRLEHRRVATELLYRRPPRAQHKWHRKSEIIANLGLHGNRVPPMESEELMEWVEDYYWRAVSKLLDTQDPKSASAEVGSVELEMVKCAISVFVKTYEQRLFEHSVLYSEP